MHVLSRLKKKDWLLGLELSYFVNLERVVRV